MTPEQEIERVKIDFAEHWPRWENHPSVRQALLSKNPVRLAELLSALVHGNRPGPCDINPLDLPRAQVVSVNRADADWMDQVYVKFHSGCHVDLENFKHPDDEPRCRTLAQSLGANALMNPAKTKFFFRQPHR